MYEDIKTETFRLRFFSVSTDDSQIKIRSLRARDYFKSNYPKFPIANLVNKEAWGNHVHSTLQREDVYQISRTHFIRQPESFNLIVRRVMFYFTVIKSIPQTLNHFVAYCIKIRANFQFLNLINFRNTLKSNTKIKFSCYISHEHHATSDDNKMARKWMSGHMHNTLPS